MQHIKEQNWFAVGLDIIVVIVGIFLGMQVTDWNESRKDRNDETEYIQRLHDELLVADKAASRVFERRIGTYDNLIEAVNVLMGNEKDLTQAQCDAIGNSDILNIVVADLPSLIELQSAGRLGIIRNVELRHSAVILQQRIVSLKEIIEQMTGQSHQLLFLFPELIKVSSVYNQQMKETNLSTSCDIVAMRNNPQFMNAVSINLDIFDAYLRDGIRPWKSEFDNLLRLTKGSNAQ